MAFDPIAVANEIIGWRRDMERLMTTNIVANKLAYIAHGVHLASNDEALVAEPIEAWQYGPVVPSIYREARSYGTAALPLLGQGQRIGAANRDARRATKTIHAVVRRYLKYDSYSLIQLTHRKGTPWYTVTNGGNELGRNKRIPDALISDYYKRMLQRAQG